MFLYYPGCPLTDVQWFVKTPFTQYRIQHTQDYCDVGTISLFHSSLDGKESTEKQEIPVRSLGWEDPLEKGKATYPLQYSGLESSMDRGVWQATVHGVPKSQTQLSDFHIHFSTDAI